MPAASAADYAAFAGTLEALFAGEYADRVSSDGIRLERYVLLAVADKPRGRRYFFFALTTSDSGVLAVGALVPSPL